MSTLLTIIHFSKRCDYSPGVTPIHQRPNSLSRVTPDATAFHQVLKLIRDREYCREGEGKREKERTQEFCGWSCGIHPQDKSSNN